MNIALEAHKIEVLFYLKENENMDIKERNIRLQQIVQKIYDAGKSAGKSELKNDIEKYLKNNAI